MMQEEPKVAFDTIQVPQKESYAGIQLTGIEGLEQSGVATREDIQQLLDRLPSNFAEITQLGEIVFDPHKCFTVERNGQVCMVFETNLLPDDKILRRVRGQAVFNHQRVDGELLATDGRQTITIYSTRDWDGEDDTDVTLYALAHELGHATFNGIYFGPHIWAGLMAAGVATNFSTVNSKLQYIINGWFRLPECTLARYTAYKEQFLLEHERIEVAGTLQETTKEVEIQEDFAISHEYYIYWSNLQDLDSVRQDCLDLLYFEMAELT